MQDRMLKESCDFMKGNFSLYGTNQPAKFGGFSHCGRGDVTYLV